MAHRSQIAAPLLFAVFVGLILYVSLWPFRFVPHGPSLLEAIGRLSWVRFSRADMLYNVLLYLPYGFCCGLLVEPRLGRFGGIVIATLSGAALSTSMEALQASIATRSSNLTDVVCNTAGALAGAACGSVWQVLGARIAPQAAAKGRSGAIALLVLVLWLIARLWPLIPDPRLRHLRHAVRPLFSPHIELKELAAYLIGWLVVAQAVFHLARRQRAVDLFLIVIATVLVGRTFTAGNALATAEVAAIALLLPVLVLLSRMKDGARAGLVAVLLGGWLAWTALQPLLSGSASISPELHALTEFITRNPPPPAQLAGKAFSDVALAWLLCSAGLVPHVAAGLTFLFVLMLSVVQLGAEAPVFGWVDVLIAAAAALIVTRWMPSPAPRSPATARGGAR